MSKIFIVGIVLGLLGAGGLMYSVQVVDLHRESSHISVAPNGGNVETLRVDLPRDRILIGLAGEESALPAELEWPSDPMFGNLQAELFKVRNRNDDVIGVASRLASASEATGPFIEWVLHLPARGTIYLQMDIAPSAEGHRNGRLTAGTREFESMRGSVREQFTDGIDTEEFNVDGRIELITQFVRPLDDEL